MTIAALVRAVAILGFAGVGGYGAFWMSQMAARPPQSFLVLGFMAFFGFIVAVVPLWSAYLIFRRDYLTLALLWIGMGAIAVYGLASNLLRWSGIQEWFVNSSSDSAGIAFLALPLGIALLVLPFWIAGQFFKRANHLAYRHLSKFPTKP